MDSSSGISSNSPGLQNSGPELDLMAQKKIKRMISNRESARRSRLRKQKHLQDLMAQVAGLKTENHQMLIGVKVATQHYLNVEAQNAILRAQAAELSRRLASLNEIAGFLSTVNGGFFEPWLEIAEPIVTAAATADTGLNMGRCY